jgi:aminoglycoside 6'-N-acetyltransferase
VETDVRLRGATASDAAILHRWDTEPHVLASDPNDDWQWDVELTRSPPWREQLMAELGGEPVGFIEIIDPREEEGHYWGDGVAPNQRAVDVWIGDPRRLGRGLGTAIMRLALARCFAPPEVEAVLIDPLASNVDAQRFYERLGFARIGPRRFGADDCIVYRLERSEWLRRERSAREQVIEQTMFIAASRGQVWEALTRPELTERYWNQTRVESQWAVGASIRYVRHGKLTDEHMVLAIEPHRRLVQTFRPLSGEFRHEPPSRVELTVEGDGAVTRLTVRHEGFGPDSSVYAACRDGWPYILSSLKTLLETGRPLSQSLPVPEHPRPAQELSA